MGETRVDLLHLLEDLRDAYPGAIEETILTEVVANALDSGATEIAVMTDPAAAALTVIDDGDGMRRRELARYHDIAATSKIRGQGIGFAGVGIKLGLLVSEEVVTETRRGTVHVATTWGLTSRQRAPWRWIPPPGLVARRGTGVRLRLQNPLSPLLDPGFVEATLYRHFRPLLDPAFGTILATHYPRGVSLVLNGARLAPEALRAMESAPVLVRLARKRKPSASGYLIRDRVPLPEDQRGLAISTFGKVITRGWDWLGLTPAAPDRIGGLIEVPALAECLALNKADFIRTGARGAVYLAYRKAIQEAVTAQLAAWGDLADPEDSVRRRAARPVERDLESVLGQLAEDFPLLASLVERRAGGQRRLPMGRPGTALGTDDVPAPLTPMHGEAPLAEAGASPGPAGESRAPADDPDAPGTPRPASTEGGAVPAPAFSGRLPSERGRRQPGRYGLSLQFAQRADDPELARLVESTVWINEAHPAYRRAVASRSEGYHIAVAVALALAPLAVEPAKEHGFLTAFLSAWGAAMARRKGRGPSRR
jgi:Histidine kinase-, DNA gyrase B-, and HSP90-like ATPase